MTAVSIGRLRHRVTLEAPLDTPDDNGGVIRSYQAVADIWANIAPMSGRRNFAGDREEQTISQRITIRWRADATAGCRFRLDSRVFHIRAVIDPDERGSQLQCLCEEIV